MINFDEFLSVDWKTQDSTEDSLLFYNLKDDTDESFSLFLKRIEKAKYKKCVINSSRASFDDVICVSKDELVKIKEEALNKIYPIKSDIKLFAVTGTNGKTTVVETFRQLCVLKQIDVLTIGTLGVMLGNENLENFNLTTPDYIDLRKVIHKYQDRFSVLAMEISSIALEQNRVGSLKYEKIGWTNFSQDHLDYHKTMDEYFRAKSLCVNCLKRDGELIVPKSEKELLEKLKGYKLKEVSFHEKVENPFFKIGYNKDNLAISIEFLEKISKVTKEDIEKLNPPAGRANIINFKTNIIVIDYAHTPDGIKSITHALKESFKDKKIITIFGCGGDRDRNKRKLMSIAAEEGSDFVYLTSDNPRFEDPMRIINDAKVGLTQNYKIIIERKDAIKDALLNQQNSVILIAGKGHEDYLDIQGVKHPYSDRLCVEEIINDQS